MNQIRTIDNLDEQVTELTEQEIADISKITIDSLITANNTYPKYDPEIWAKLVEEMGDAQRLRDKTKGSYSVLYEDDGRVVGYGRLEKYMLEANEIVIGESVWQLKNLQVDSKAQRKGIGKAIVTKLEEKAKSMGIGTLYLESWIFEPTVGFHEGNEYRIIGENHHKQLGGTFVTYVMEKPLG